ncbi:MAG TPA: carboxypeptidase-like regulatory domain-containing protein, partial [Candidatus Thermoplasmatota archaeon]|nr:carboxypeptidase-like regulatory domain-containing protein [Candidatus Thermoplasmatota archaeon]
STPLGDGLYSVRIPAAPPGTYHLYARGADGRGNLQAMPVLVATAPEVAPLGDVFLMGVDDPTKIPLVFKGRTVAHGAFTSLAYDADADSGMSDAVAPSSGASPTTGAPQPPMSDKAYQETKATSQVVYKPTGLPDAYTAEGTLRTDTPRLIAEPPFLYAREAQNLTLSAYHPDRGVLAGVPVTVRTADQVLAEGRTNTSGAVTLHLTPPATLRGLDVVVGNATVHTVPVLRGLAFSVGGDRVPGENITLAFRDRATGAPVDAVRLSLAGTVRLPSTDDLGQVTFRLPSAGTYPLRATRDGFAPLERPLVVGDAPAVPMAPPQLLSLAVVPSTEVIVAHVDVVNPTNETVTLEPRLSLDGTPAAAHEVVLEPGEARTVTLVAPAPPGYHNVSLIGTNLTAKAVFVDDLQVPLPLFTSDRDLRATPAMATPVAGTPAATAAPAMTAAPTAKGSAPAEAESVPGPGLLLVVVAALGIALLVGRRR